MSSPGLQRLLYGAVPLSIWSQSILFYVGLIQFMFTWNPPMLSDFSTLPSLNSISVIVVVRLRATPFVCQRRMFLYLMHRSLVSCQVIDLVLSVFLNLQIQIFVLLGGCALTVIKLSSFHNRLVSVISDLSIMPAVWT